MQGDFSLGELAVRFGLGLQGDPGLVVSRVATLSHAEPGAISFLANPRYRRQMESTRATAVLVGPDNAASCPVATLIDPNPYLAYARIADLMHPRALPVPGIHPSAVVSGSARIPASASVGSLAVIEDEVELGERVFVGPGCIVQRGARLGADTWLTARVNVYADVRIGQRCIVHAGAVIGADGFGFAPDAGRWVKVPQVGTVRVGDDVEIGANTCVDRATLGSTVIGEGSKLDNMVHIAHNCRIGKHVVIAAQTGLAGGVSVGDYAIVGGQVGVGDKARIESRAVIGSGAGILTSKIVRAGEPVWGTPARPLRRYLEQLATLARLSKRRDNK